MGWKNRRPTTTRYGWKNPWLSAFWKRYWAQPGIREKRKADPYKYSRVGTSNQLGVRRDIAELLAAEAGQFADQYMKELEKAGVVRSDDVIIPDSEEALAKAALREAAALALNIATPRKDKLTAINTVLAYTKAKPVQKQEVTVKSPEDWLKDTLAACHQVPTTSTSSTPD